MHLLLSILVTALWIVLGVIGSVVLIGVLIAIGVSLRKPLEIARNPRCRYCHGLCLQSYKLPFADAQEFRYYRCNHCCTHLKRSASGEWVTLPRGTARDVDRGKLFARPANLVVRAAETDSSDPLGSWFGSIHVALPEESWPEYGGVPMLPLCQLRCAEIPNLPFALKHVALVCVFTAFVGASVGFVIRVSGRSQKMSTGN